MSVGTAIVLAACVVVFGPLVVGMLLALLIAICETLAEVLR
jgi:hypothetical protein